MAKPLTAVEHLAATLRAHLQARELSETEFAKKAGLAQKTVNNMLHGRHPAKLDSIEKAAVALGIGIWELLLPANGTPNTSARSVSKLITAYRHASESGQDLIMQIAEREVAHAARKL